MLSKAERAKLEELRASRPDDEVCSVLWAHGEPVDIVWASDLAEACDHIQFGLISP